MMRYLLALAMMATSAIAGAQDSGPIHVELRSHTTRSGLLGKLVGTKEPNTSAVCQTTGTTTSCDIQNQVNVGFPSIFNMERHRSKKLGMLFASGDCEGARSYAFGQGDFKLIHNVAKFCPGYGQARPIANAGFSNLYGLPTEIKPGMSPEEIGRIEGRQALERGY
jgi:hypothetical protein